MLLLGGRSVVLFLSHLYQDDQIILIFKSIKICTIIQDFLAEISCRP
jgi:hypothetical protein